MKSIEETINKILTESQEVDPVDEKEPKKIIHRTLEMITSAVHKSKFSGALEIQTPGMGEVSVALKKFNRKPIISAEISKQHTGGNEYTITIFVFLKAPGITSDKITATGIHTAKFNTSQAEHKLAEFLDNIVPIVQTALDNKTKLNSAAKKTAIEKLKSFGYAFAKTTKG